MEISFDRAIELLEITDISKVKVDDIPKLEKKAKGRWHPDRVSHLGDDALTKEYTVNFQQVEVACQLIYSFLKGTYQAGNTHTYTHRSVREEPEDIIRKNAPELQSFIRSVWATVKEKRYQWTVEEVLLSDGYKLRDLIDRDYKEDIALYSMVSLFYGLVFFGLPALVALGFNPILGWVLFGAWTIHAIACLIGVAPLSRFWLPIEVSDVMVWLINVGLGIYHWAERQVQNSEKVWLVLLVRIPVLYGKLVKYLIMFPIYEIAKLVIGDKMVGVVKAKVNYYTYFAEWYIDALIAKDPKNMTVEELYDLTEINSAFQGVENYQPPRPEYDSTTYNSPKPAQVADVKTNPVPPKPQEAKEPDKAHFGAQPKKEKSKKKIWKIALVILMVILLFACIGLVFWYFVQPEFVNRNIEAQSTSHVEDAKNSTNNSSTDIKGPDFNALKDLNQHFESICCTTLNSDQLTLEKNAVLAKFTAPDAMISMLKNGVAVEYMTITDFMAYVNLNHYRYKVTNLRTDANGKIIEASATRIN